MFHTLSRQKMILPNCILYIDLVQSECALGVRHPECVVGQNNVSAYIH